MSKDLDRIEKCYGPLTLLAGYKGLCGLGRCIPLCIYVYLDGVQCTALQIRQGKLFQCAVTRVLAPLALNCRESEEISSN